ncbi:hypothetical protein J2X98_001740 [Pseudarthrobacter enclensis]|uniref:Uncharacterized protein n=2 Tax=Pseudarthrobacter enclensis TaxID=993070 RepID=A0ABT9RSD1_9MICC|nr:hypothetical protein [Pseudarthrobacter enclensis]
MTMVQHRSELSMSRTGIHGGIRRGTAAAAVGAVLVLSTGVQASLADDAVPPPQDPAAPAASAAAFGLSIAARQTAAVTPGPDVTGGSSPQGSEGQNPAGPGAGAPAARTPRTPSAIPTVPDALLPVITVSPSADWTAAPTGPATSGTPMAPGPQTTSAAAPTGSPSVARPGASTPAGSGAASAPGAASAAGAAPAAGVTGQLPAVAAPAEGTAPAAGQGGAAPVSGEQSAVPGAGAGVNFLPGTLAAGADGPGAQGATASPLPTALSINARNSQPTRLPQAAGEQAGPGRPVSFVGPLRDVPGAMVWLGAGLVGVGAAAGLVFLRMRRP